ncbi:MAG TPA: LEA type 2 family protein [Steroidobacteraceae bacterium]|nr:LEA type 2 family protein [Steroidobacteraceae bacterium]
MSRAQSLRAGLVGVLALVAGCTLLGHWQTPTLSVVSIQLGHSDLWQQHLQVRMSVHNPNDRELPVEGLSYSLDVNGEECAHGESGASFLVPARGDAEFDMNVTANAAAALLRMFARGNAAPVQYRIHGKVQLSAGLLRSVPFDQQGALPLR